MSGSEPRILHVFRAPVGGLFRHVVDLAREQAARGYPVGIFCDSSTGGSRADEVLNELRPHLSLGVTRVPMRRNPSTHDLSALFALTGVYRGARPNVLHAHGSKGGVYARMTLNRVLDRDTIRAYTPHGGSFNYEPETRRHRLYMAVEKLLTYRTDVFLFESAFIAGLYRKYVGETDRLVRIVHNGISKAEFEPIDPAAARYDLLYIGEMRAAKGIDTLLEAMALLRGRGQHLTLLAVGSGPEEEQLRQRADFLGLKDVVTFRPPQPIRAVLGQAKVMVVASRAESLPYVILEAAAAAQPLVSTDVGGIPEIFGPLVDELIPPNSAAVLADAIAAKLAEPDTVRHGKARQLSAHVAGLFCIDRMTDTVLDAYAAAFATRRGKPAADLVPNLR